MPPTFHLSASARAIAQGCPAKTQNNDRALAGQLVPAITAPCYPLTVWSAGAGVKNHVQISVANLQAGSYAVWMGLYSPATQVRVSVEAGFVAAIEGRARLLESQIAP